MSETNVRGYIVVVEGGDGCGTTTHAAILADGIRSWLPLFPQRVLDGMGLSGEVAVLRGPSDSDFGMYIRRKYECGDFSSHRAAAMAFALDRREHFEREVRGLLDSGCLVIFDRYVHSSVAHQGIPGDCVDFVIACNSEVPAPNVALHLYADARTAASRIVMRCDDPMANSAHILAELEKQRADWNATWLEASSLNYPHDGFKPCSVDTSAGTIDEIAKTILAEVTARVIEECLARNPS